VTDEHINDGMILTGKAEAFGETCPCAKFSTTDPTCTDPEANPGLSAEKPAPNNLRYGKVYKGCISGPILILQLSPENDRYCQQVIKPLTPD
jgi:hypothetical protein